MNLSDYDILGVSKNDSYRIIKNSYHDLVRIYHPDSTLVIKHLTKEERLIGFNKIETAFKNIKKKLNVIEIDLPKNELIYSEENIERNESIQDQETFNKEFEKIHSEQSKDEPFSIYYSEPKNKLDDTKVTLKPRDYLNNPYEFGINYVSDYSGENYSDVSIQQEITNEDKKDEIDPNLEDKLNNLMERRNEKIELSSSEKDFINNQNDYLKELKKSKREIHELRNVKLISK